MISGYVFCIRIILNFDIINIDYMEEADVRRNLGFINLIWLAIQENTPMRNTELEQILVTTLYVIKNPDCSADL